MARIVEREVVATPVVTEDRDGGAASSAIWAIAFIIIVGIIAGAVYYSGILRRVPNPTQKIDVKVSAPASNP